MAALLVEFEHNRRTIRRFSGDDLVPLRTSSWETNQHLVRDLPPLLQDELDSVYGDINLLNHLVWLSSEYDRKSSSIREHYLMLGTSIADRLDRLLNDSLSPAVRAGRDSTAPASVS